MSLNALSRENSNLSNKANRTDIIFTDYATFSNKDGWSVNQGTDTFSRYCKKSNDIIYMSAPVTSYTSVSANTGVTVATLSKAPSTIQILVGRHTSSNGNQKGVVTGYINRGGEITVYSTAAIVSSDVLYVKSVPATW